jgi:hypothetical protein
VPFSKSISNRRSREDRIRRITRKLGRRVNTGDSRTWGNRWSNSSRRRKRRIMRKHRLKDGSKRGVKKRGNGRDKGGRDIRDCGMI